MKFPKMIEVRQKLHAPVLEDAEGEVRRQIEGSRIRERIRAGDEVAVTAGSRGITNIPAILRTVVEEIEKLGAAPFIVPSMGSHGGGTAEGQVEVLAGYGITETSVLAPIRSSMEVVQVGEVEDGIPVLIDRIAYGADAIMVVNRVKPHTSFRGPVESGLMKMMTIGLGKHEGATLAHSFGSEGLSRMIPAWGRVILKEVPIALGVAIVENAYEQTAKIVAVEPEDFERSDMELLEEAGSLMPTIPFDRIDVLVVEEIGKNISGTGMDTNIIGRIMIKGVPDPERPDVTFLVALDLTEESHGNAMGIGLADVVPQRLVDKVNRDALYANVFTSTFLNRAKIPVTMPTDREAIGIALEVLRSVPPEHAKVVRIKNTLELERIHISEVLLEEARDKAHLEFVGTLEEMQFDDTGTLKR